MLPPAACVIQDTLVLQGSRFYQKASKLEEGAWQSCVYVTCGRTTSLFNSHDADTEISPVMVTRDD